MRRLRLATTTAVALSAITMVATQADEPARAGVACKTGEADFASVGNLQCYTVPAGVTSLDVTAVGGTGGFGAFVEERRRGTSALGVRTGSPGGAGAQVSGAVDVEPGQTLYVIVGGNGSSPNQEGSGLGGYNGGGDSPVTGLGFAAGGGGGGASDVRTEPCAGPDCDTNATSLASRVIVAGGGGGGGFDQQADSLFGGDGGTPNGEDGVPVDGGGKGAAQSSGGAAAEAGVSEPGALGVGGDGSDFSGAGGGGLYGGGGGGSSASNGGGGGGSSLVPAGGTSSLDQTRTPTVSIAPSLDGPLDVRTLRPVGVQCRAATLRGRIWRGGEGIRYRFALGRVGRPLKLTRFRQGSPANPIYVGGSRQLGLKPGARYRYRIIAKNDNATDRGDLVRFRTSRGC